MVIESGKKSLDVEETIIPTFTVLPLLGSKVSHEAEAVAVIFPSCIVFIVKFQALSTVVKVDLETVMVHGVLICWLPVFVI